MWCVCTVPAGTCPQAGAVEGLVCRNVHRGVKKFVDILHKAISAVFTECERM